MSRILFVVPPYTCWGVQQMGNWPPLQLTYAAGAALSAGHEARVFDAMNKKATFDDIRGLIESYRPDFVMTLDYLPVSGSISTATVPAALRVLTIAKQVNPDITTIIGGPHPTFMYEEILTDENNRADYVVRGEPERTLVDLMSAVPEGTAGGVNGLAFLGGGELVVTPERQHIDDLDSLEPAWHLLDWEDYHYNTYPWGRMASVLTSRGCMMGCSFCAQRRFWRGEWRARDPKKVVAEMRHLVEVHGVEHITLIDAYPTYDRDRWERILDLLIEADLGVTLLMETRVEDILRDEDILHKYRAAGVIHLYVGAESSTDELLESLNKGTTVDQNQRALALCREHDIMTEASFMIGFPTETWESIQKTSEVAIRLNPDIAVFPVLTPMPFTPLWEEMRDRIRITDYSLYNLVTPIIEPYEMSLEDITVALGRCYMTFYARKMKDVLALPDGFRREYMLSAMKTMMKDYGEHFDFPVGMPRMPGMPGIKAMDSMGSLRTAAPTAGSTRLRGR
ncbi:MAG: B12-binding domain-containing radical SAM protein [Actinobacteria bacterium HGW-Actinobacteria-10]|jgi:anaerobic magnesium-protoporphyrin IX monomethyl ester cyclase|nr:MAG: B12-binding domain-containing radical SAM protein [Actinobacteria bacterium HGW-Actinobacteria-10]